MIEHLEASTCFTSSLNKKPVNRIRQNTLVSNSELDRISRAPFSPPPSQNKSVSEKGFHYILRAVRREVRPSPWHLACRLYTLPGTSRFWAICLPKASNAAVARPKSGRLRAVLLQRSPSPPLLPSHLNHQICYSSLLPSASLFKDKGITICCARCGPNFSLLRYISFPAASEPLSAVRFCSLNATGLRLQHCCHSVSLRAKKIPFLTCFPLGSEHSHLLILSTAIQVQHWFSIHPFLPLSAPIPVYFHTQLLNKSGGPSTSSVLLQRTWFSARLIPIRQLLWAFYFI